MNNIEINTIEAYCIIAVIFTNIMSVYDKFTILLSPHYLLIQNQI